MVNSTTKDKIEKSEKELKASILPQVRCALSASFGFFVSGTVGGWSGPALTKLTNDFAMGPTQYSIVACLISYGSVLGCGFSGKAMDSLGRRKVLLLTAPIAASGWAVIGFATNIYMVYIGRFFSGVASGIFLSSCPIYASETCQAKLRGRLGIFSTISLAVGTFFAFLIGGLFSWQTSAFISCIPTVILFINMSLVPESPYWFLLKGNHEAASESLRKLRGPTYYIDQELDEMSRKISDVGPNVSFRELFKSRTRIPLAVVLYVQTMQQFCPGNLVSIYASSIFEKALCSIDSHVSTIYLGLTMVVGTIITIFTIDKFGRKFLLSMSVSLAGLFCLLFGGYCLALKSENPWPNWTPLVILVLFMLSFCLGGNSIPWMIGSEVFNTSVRSRANALAILYNRILSSILLQMYPYMVEALGEAAVFFSYGIVCVLFAIGTVLFVPETKGKSLEQIQEYFESRATKNKNKNNKLCSTKF